MIIARSHWEAGPLRAGRAVEQTRFVGIVLHHTVMDQGRESHEQYMRRLQTARPDLGNEVPYHFVVFKDGATYEGRGAGWSGAHAGRPWNHTHYGVAFTGNLSRRAITGLEVAAVHRIRVAHLAHVAGGAILAHGAIGATECPGASVLDAMKAGRFEVQAPAPALEVPGRIIDLGSVGPDVTAWQTALLAWLGTWERGAMMPWAHTVGTFDQATRQWSSTFQRHAFGTIGPVGPRTRRAMIKVLKDRPSQ